MGYYNFATPWLQQKKVFRKWLYDPFRPMFELFYFIFWILDLRSLRSDASPVSISLNQHKWCEASMAGSWALLESLFEEGNPAFLTELRLLTDAERLGKFTTKWYSDRRPIARQFIIEYLSQDLNAFHHEALVKRLFKLVEKAGDDELMGCFLVAFDRTIRRERRRQSEYRNESFKTEALAQAKSQEWAREGFQVNPLYRYSGKIYVSANRPYEVVITPIGTTVPRDLMLYGQYNYLVNVRKKKLYLFSPKTRRYMRRRCWRYFRKLGKVDSNRYRNAAIHFLKRYEDKDVDSDIHLLDNWGLMHALFHHSEAIQFDAKGFGFAPGKTIQDLTAAPYYIETWKATAEPLIELLLQAKSQTVRAWAQSMLTTHHPRWLQEQSLEFLFRLLDHPDLDLMRLALDGLDERQDLESVPIEFWLKLLDGDNLEKLTRIGALLTSRLQGDRVSLVDTIRLTLHRSFPVAKLGLHWLQQHAIDEAKISQILALTHCECEMLRNEIATWLKVTLSSFGQAKAEWLIDFLDGKHPEVRTVGWNWFMESELKEDYQLWHKLIESPYLEMQRRIVANLNQRIEESSLGGMCQLWAIVLLNVHGSGRVKPGIIARLVDRLQRHPQDHAELLPLLSIALRSLRGPEFRTGLVGVVQLVETKAELRGPIRKQFPELQILEYTGGTL
jgi:hypothetical protein